MQWFESIGEKLEGLDIGLLINNAAMSIAGYIEKIKSKSIKKMI